MAAEHHAMRTKRHIYIYTSWKTGELQKYESKPGIQIQNNASRKKGEILKNIYSSG